DGSKIAFVRTQDTTRYLALAQLSPEKKVLGASRIGEVKLRDLEWADNDHLMITTSATGMPWGFVGHDAEWFKLSVYELSTKKFKTYPYPDEHDQNLDTVAGIRMVRHVGNDTLLFIPSLCLRGELVPCLYRVNLATHAQRLVRDGNSNTLNWLVDE